MTRLKSRTQIERLPRRLSCFVAMAFGNPETDRLFDHVIVPTLNAVNLRAVRVDRVEHNGDIDDRIIQELKECCLVIADLTFARQSVYFEAGYAQRVVPVIYTCRRDHFDRGAPDNARVHFDLQMRNIIDWRKPDDPKFRLRLAKRLNYVLRPILTAERRAFEYGRQEAEFRSLSVNEQRRAMKQLLRDEFAKARFKTFDIPSNDNGSYTPKENDLRARVSYGYKRRGQFLTLVEGLVPDGAALKSLLQTADYETTLQKEWFDANKGKKLYFSRHIFVCASEKIPRRNVLRSLTNFIFDPNRECFVGTMLGLFSWRYAGQLFRLPLLIHVLDSVKSLVELQLEIRNRLQMVRPQEIRGK